MKHMIKHTATEYAALDDKTKDVLASLDGNYKKALQVHKLIKGLESEFGVLFNTEDHSWEHAPAVHSLDNTTFKEP
ncbi:hypothetical protein G3R49_19335 [Shewanella sp. WXL01]|uniref:hypothetical protein n=1 Tax=Shewanella sp. WXL01 TaxID=2709721 RepID=UPI0014385E44|nr:hypothetical protein [Shewanella sp. WXL01]NKF52713.1 hypothetical protein [Shewanella sp. WXL01]